jgi:hypothetical protein
MFLFSFTNGSTKEIRFQIKKFIDGLFDCAKNQDMQKSSQVFRRYVISLDPDLHRRMKILAAKEGIGLASLTRDLILTAMKKYERRNERRNATASV